MASGVEMSTPAIPTSLFLRTSSYIDARHANSDWVTCGERFDQSLVQGIAIVH